MFAATDRPLVERDGRVHAFCHSVPGRWHLMSVMLSAAGSLRWFRDALAPDLDFAALDAEAATVRVGSDGLVFLPYLTGERSPHPDPLARGAFVGLTVTHDRRHLARAVLEGVAFGLRDGLEQMTATGLAAPDQIRASGGGIASATWRQILADVLQAEIATVATAEGAAFGAAMLAAVGAEWFPDVGQRGGSGGAGHPDRRAGTGRVGLHGGAGVVPGPVSSVGAHLPRPGWSAVGVRRAALRAPRGSPRPASCRG